jgi:hypothetical protein
MHTVKIAVLADQEVVICGYAVNIHDLVVIQIDGQGRIVSFSAKDKNGKIWRRP